MLRGANLWICCLLGVLVVARAVGASVCSRWRLGTAPTIRPPSPPSCPRSTKSRARRATTNEVYAIADHPREMVRRIPAMTRWIPTAGATCLSEFESYVGIAYEDSRLDLSYILPVRDGWERDDDREFICFLYDLNLEKLSGSMQGAASSPHAPDPRALPQPHPAVPPRTPDSAARAFAQRGVELGVGDATGVSEAGEVDWSRSLRVSSIVGECSSVRPFARASTCGEELK